MAHPPPSFGRTGPGQTTVQPVAVDMPDQLPVVTLPVVMEVDPESLKRLSENLTAVIAAAVRAGYATAVEDIESEADQVDGYDNPPRQLSAVLQEFIDENREMLERLGRVDAAQAPE